MGKMTEEELLSIIDRYGYDIIEDYGSLKAVKRNSIHIIPEKTPSYCGGTKYSQLKHTAAWILWMEKD